MFSDGLLAQTVDKVVAEGAAYFSSAGNNGLEAYQSNYQPVSIAQARQMVADGKENIDIDALAAHGLPAQSFHMFRNRDGSPSFTQRFTSYFGDIVDFQWDEPFDLGKVKTDYNIYVFDANGHFIDPNDPVSDAFFTSDDNIDTDQAIELMAVNPGTYQIVIAKVNNGPAQRIKYITVNGTGESEIQNAPSGPHGGASRPVDSTSAGTFFVDRAERVNSCYRRRTRERGCGDAARTRTRSIATPAGRSSDLPVSLPCAGRRAGVRINPRPAKRVT